MIHDSLQSCAARLVTGVPVGFCTGGFDLFHARHARFLSLAFEALFRETGDPCALVVGVDTDDKVRRRKRREPYYPWPDRAELVACHACVHEVFPLDADDATEAVDFFRPVVYVVGIDHTEEPRPGSARARCVELGGRSVRVAPAGVRFGTAEIVDAIRERLLAELHDGCSPQDG